VPHYSGVFHTGSASQLFQVGMTQTQTETLHTQLTAQGYNAIDVETYELAGSRYFAVVWQQSSTFTSELILDTEASDFSTVNGDELAAGLALDDLESWSDASNTVHYVGIWRNDVSGRIFDMGLTWLNFQALVYGNMAVGLVMVDVDSYKLGGLTYYTSIWEFSAAELPVFEMGNCYDNVLSFENAQRSDYVMIDFEIIIDDEFLAATPSTSSCGTPYPALGVPSTIYYPGAQVFIHSLIDEPSCRPSENTSTPDCYPSD